jgi:transposase, IS5 family
MKRYISTKQTTLSFALPFEGTLNAQNRWVLLGDNLPWDDLVSIYTKTLDDHIGRPSVDARVVIGAMFIKHLRKLSDEETVELVSENPYMQYFLGLSGFQQTKIFDASLFVTLRKRLGLDGLDKMNDKIILFIQDLDEKIAKSAEKEVEIAEKEVETSGKEAKNAEKEAKNAEKEDNLEGDSSKIIKKKEKNVKSVKKSGRKVPKAKKKTTKSGETTVKQAEAVKTNAETGAITHKGQLKIDATVAPQYIAFPTDINLLNQARELSEELIDAICSDKGQKKPRTYREKARRDYLNIARNRKKSKKKLRKGIKQQLGYLRRNLLNISILLKNNYLENTLPSVWTTAQQTQYKTIITLHEQQQEMYKSGKQSCANRIVSLSQAHVRPIVRGKAHRNTEFGAKLGLSTYNGLTRLDHLSWDAYNETNDLKLQVERYHALHGYYPESVNADKIYATRANYAYLKELGIRFVGKSLGRPAKITQTAEAKRTKQQELNQRNHIEGKIGQAKNAYGLDSIKAKTKTTSEAWIAACVLATNLVTGLRRLRQLFLSPIRYSTFSRNYTFFIPQKRIFAFFSKL